MRVILLCSFIDYTKGTKNNMYVQEDGKYYVLQTPINPSTVNGFNVHIYSNLTKEEALEKMEYPWILR